MPRTRALRLWKVPKDVLGAGYERAVPGSLPDRSFQGGLSSSGSSLFSDEADLGPGPRLLITACRGGTSTWLVALGWMRRNEVGSP